MPQVAFKSFSESEREKIIQEGVDLLQHQQPNLSAVKRLLDAKYKTSVCLDRRQERKLNQQKNKQEMRNDRLRKRSGSGSASKGVLMNPL